METSANTVAAAFAVVHCGKPVGAKGGGVFFMWNKVSHRILFDLSEKCAIKIPSD